MGIADWLRGGKDPVLQHLVQVYGLRPDGGGSLAGRLRNVSLRTFEKQSFARGIDVQLGDCADEPCFGFFRPGADDLRDAVAFGADGMTRWESGEAVHLSGFFIDYEGEARWRTLLERRAVEIADYLALYSPALSWVYLHFPGLAFKLAAPEAKRAAVPDLTAIERDVATSLRLHEFLRDSAASDA